MAEPLADRLDRRVRSEGPIPVSTYVEAALYDPDGFYIGGQSGRAGRRGDFLTAPEVGPLFGAVVARTVDSWWRELGEPDVYTVHEWGAGPGTLARTVLAAEPDVLAAGAFRWVMIERSVTQRRLQPTHMCLEGVAEPDPAPVTGAVIANELLDNLPFDIVERMPDGWAPVLVGARDRGGRFTLHHGPVDPGLAMGDSVVGTRVPVQTAARDWLAAALGSVTTGRVAVFDYGADTVELAGRGMGWLRTHRDHDGTADWLVDPGSCDVTCDVAIDQLQTDHPADSVRPQDEWLRVHGIDELVEEGRRIWEASAGVGDLAALTARSRIREAEALLDPAGMGAFHVLEWVVGTTG